MCQIVQKLEPITLAGAGVLASEDLSAALEIGSTLIAADGGAAHCIAAGHLPDVVIGDMDSLAENIRESISPERLIFVAEQDSTDFDKALRHILAPVVLAVGFTGARVDHELACYNALTRHADRRCVIIGESDVVCLLPPKLALHVPAGTRLSLFPMGAVEGRSEGLKWPIDGIAFAPDGMVGTSNEATGVVQLEVEAPGMLLILPKAHLGLLVSQLLATPAGWPAP
ncbi:thiamine diphosphokinase [Shimia sp. MMG029]|uniref:thiamine diphosphokinase n=1 Tax=Shimia sp. MMG029 TaxID=3021978 RepID=UPI0022FF3256|nr:thiamine diphosphokinase [Shimia sp. MMG029]MDA5555502.1 thiamine diphosphokinase [Shimia sp. MMG029]